MMHELCYLYVNLELIQKIGPHQVTANDGDKLRQHTQSLKKMNVLVKDALMLSQKIYKELMQRKNSQEQTSEDRLEVIPRLKQLVVELKKLSDTINSGRFPDLTSVNMLPTPMSPEDQTALEQAVSEMERM